MATNYFIAQKTDVETELNAMALPAAIVSKILSSFGDTVKVVDFNAVLVKASKLLFALKHTPCLTTAFDL
jgi:hypothetical protein